MNTHALGAIGRKSLASALVLAGVTSAFTSISVDAAEINLRVSGLVSTHKYHVALERSLQDAFGENRPQI